MTFMPEMSAEALVQALDSLDVAPFTNTKIYSKINPNNLEELHYFKKIVLSFQQFVAFLRDPTAVIDYTYLWDIITRPNPAIFSQGINLVILEIPEDDATNNVEIICPTNHYSSEFYEARKQTLILMRKGEFFEPIYSYRDEEKRLKISKTFSEYDPNLSKTIRAVFKEIIKPLIQTTCAPLASLPNVYKFKQPILLANLIHQLHKIGYDVVVQVVNYNTKVIGVVVENEETGTSGFLPCYPSEINPTYNYTLLSDDSMFAPYEKTRRFLMQIHDESRGKIPCKPEFKVVEDDHVVGIISETNQFIQVSDVVMVEDTATDSLKVLHDSNFLIADKKTMDTLEVDRERVEYIKKIKLESNFFNVFRNTIRMLLNDYENLETREKIEQEVGTPYILYSAKLHTIIDYLKELVGDSIVFVEDYDISLVDHVSTCMVLPENKCQTKSPVCVITDDKKCQLVIPKFNLLNGNDNEIYYFGKLADEIIRYNRVKSYLFQPDTHLSFSPVNYNLYDNEILVIQSVLSQEYFAGLEPVSENKYVNYTTYDTAEPKKTQLYESTVALDEDMGLQRQDPSATEVKECVTKTNPKISSKIWYACFPTSFREIEYEKSVYCGFHLLANIIRYAFPETSLSENDVRRELLEQYMRYLPKYEGQIVDILIAEDKKTLGAQVKAKTLSFQNFIYSDNYFITTLDIWMLVEKYSIPTIFISSKPILQAKDGKTEFVGYGSVNDRFLFIVLSALQQESIQKFKIIQSAEGDITFPITICRTEECSRRIMDAIEQQENIETYLQHFTKKPAKKKTVAAAAKKGPRPKLVLRQPEATAPAAAKPEVGEPVVPVEEPKPEPEPVVLKQKTTIKIKKNTSRKKKTVLKESAPEP